ncbi:hypothetical protein RB595_005935 [Gaeumannomyces hyphopodioides]
MDDFSDDGFDELNDTVLQELENNAIQFTQAQTFNQTQAPPQGAGRQSHLDAEDEDLDDTVVFDELAQQPAHPLPTQQQTRIVPTVAQHHRLQWNQPPTNLQRPSHAAATISSRPRYPGPPQLGKPRDTQAISGRAEPFQRPPPPRAIPPVRPAARPSVAPAQFAPPPSTGRPLPGNFSTGIASQAVSHAPPGSQSGNIIAALQARLNSLQTELTTAKGEAAILRTKFLGAQEAHEADLARIRKQNAEQLARQERIAEQALAAEKTVATELHFARQDLRDERGVRTRKGKKGKDKDAGGATTPKKGAAASGAAAGASRSNWAMPDGFDDIELMPSPSKAAARRAKDAGSQPPILSFGERTPSKGKRKRPAVDSPLLELETDDVAMIDGSPVKDEPGASNTRPGPLPFDFLTLVLDHGALHGHPLTFELFYRYSFPSDQAQTFGSFIFSKLPLLGSPQDPIRLLVDFCLLIIEMWRRCVEEEYYEPIYDLVALVSFTLQLRTVQVAPHIVAYLLPVAQSTVNLVAVPRFKSVDGDLANNPDPGVQRVLASVDTTPILGLMYLAALGCAGAPPDLVDGQEPTSPLLQYWKMLQPEFVLMLLSHKQKPDDFFGVLALLRTSALQSSLGPIVLDSDSSGDVDVHVVARVLVERISYAVSDPPRWAPQRSRRMCEVKLAALQTLITFARTSFGLAKLIQSDHAIPRLVTALSGAIDMLYDMEIPTSTFPLHDDIGLAPSGELSPQDEPQDPNMTQEDPQASASVPGKESPGAGAAIDAAPVPVRIEDNHPPTALLHAIISALVLLLHTLVTASPSDETGNDAGVHSSSNVAAKLAASHGGSQRYLLTLARINFAEEDLVLEAGVDSETAELANELLELAVTPDEGEGVRNVFGFEET